MSSLKNTAGTNEGNVTKDRDERGRKNHGSSDNRDNSAELKDNPKEKEETGAKKKKPTIKTDDEDENTPKNKSGADAKQKDQEKESTAHKRDNRSAKKGSAKDKERAESLMKPSEPSTGPKDLFYLFQKYSDKEKSTKNTETISLNLLKKWLGQASLLNEKTGITETYAEELFQNSTSGTDVIDFEEFQNFLYSMAAQKKQSYPELMHNLLSAGKPQEETDPNKEFRKTVENSFEKLMSSESSEVAKPKGSATEYSHSSEEVQKKESIPETPVLTDENEPKESAFESSNSARAKETQKIEPTIATGQSKKSDNESSDYSEVEQFKGNDTDFSHSSK